MSKITGNEPIGIGEYQEYNRYGDKEGTPYRFKGLSIRQYYAGLAMQGICANTSSEIKPFQKEIAYLSVSIADALIKQLNEAPNP